MRDIEITSEPPTNPLLDGRAWYRTSAQAWLLLRTSIFRLPKLFPLLIKLPKHAVWWCYSPRLMLPSPTILAVPISTLARTRSWSSHVQVAIHAFTMIVVMNDPLLTFVVQSDSYTTRDGQYRSYFQSSISDIVVRFPLHLYVGQ